jgi:uncharacterized membrane protein YgcG
MALISLSLAGGSAFAGWHEWWHRVHVDFYRNNSWPEPFSTIDRAAEREPFCIMVDNGWKMQNTIGTFLFDRETQRLNQAGELLVKWIVTQAPHHRRAVFVLKGDTAEATTTRVESVQQAVAKYTGGHACAAYIDSITQQFNATIPAPRLPEQSSGSSGGAGGGSGSGSGGGSQ